MDRRRAAAALLALAACIACSAAAPTASNHTALEIHDGPVEGCYYNFQHYGEGDRIMTNEPCLNCTCHNRMLMCYLRVCPFTKAIGQDCTVEKRADQCCPIVTCPDVPVDLLTSTSTSSPAEYGATGVGRLDKYGCTVHGKYFPEGAKVPPTPNKPCEHCYCIRNMTTCVMQECTLHVDGCTPIYHKDVCCPVRYSCDHPEDEVLLLDDMTTTVRPTPGFLLTTTTISPVTQMSQDCVHDDQIFPDGALIKTEKACEHCYCMKGDIVCVVQECGTPMENEGKNCTSLPPRPGQCCPDTYICEGDERAPDSTTEIELTTEIDLTSSPPRRVGVEGSGYRNEPDEPYTEISPLTTEIEGSGEEYMTAPQIDTGDNVKPEKETPQIIDETLLTTTEISLQFSQSTEPDKGQNTIPDIVIDKETPQDKVTLSSFGSPMTTIFEEYTTTKDLVTRKDEISTTESIVKEDDESVSHKTSTPKDVTFEDEQATTDFTELLEKTTHTDEEISHKEEKEATTVASIEYTDKVQETSKEEEMSTESIGQSTTVIVTDKDILSKTSPETVTESTTYLVTNPVVAESTSVNPNINEIDDNVSPNLSPSRIPGEGDCLLNGVTYNNNTNVPSTNNCHTGCKCISSIIKCDPIICSPPPEYMENMNDCQPIYDTPNSCCPTYVCSVKETIPPESHSHMSGTESPKPVTASECVGNDCIESEEMKPPTEPITCTSGNCLSETPAIQKCESDDCKEQTEISPLLPSQDCSDGKCQLPVVPCQGEDCKIEPSKHDISDKDLQSTKSPAMQECDSNDCTDQIQTKPQDCADGKCEILPTTPCEGDNCKHIEPSSHDVPICNQENGCEESNVIVQDECVGESCNRKDVAEVGGKVPFKCSGSECKLQDEPNIKPDHVTEMIYEGTTVSDKDLQKTESLESQTTTSKDKFTESDTDVTKQSIFTEPPEKLSTTSEQIVTERPQKHDTDNELLQTSGPVVQAFTEEPEDHVTKTEIIQPESPKLPTADTTESQDMYTRTEERFTTEINLPSTKQTEYVEIDTEKSIDLSYTKVPEYVEIDTEKSITGENEQMSTLKPQISIDSRETVSDAENTKSPQSTVTESEKPVTVLPILTVTENEAAKTEETETEPSKTSNMGSESTEASMLEGTQTTLLKEKEKVPGEVPGVDKEQDEIITRSPELIITDKEVLQTEVPETFTLGVDIQTQAPETLTTERVAIETETIKVTTAEKEEVHTDIPDILTPVKDITSTEYPDQLALQTTSPEIKGTTKETIEIEGQELVTTEESRTKAPVTSATKKEDDQKHIIEIATEKEVIEVSIPERHDEELEFTTVHEFSQTPMEGQSITLSPETDENDTSRVTEEPSVKPLVTITEIPVVTEEKEYDETHKSKPIIPDSEPTEGTTEMVTEHLATNTPHETVTESFESDITKMVSQPGASVTESILYPTIPEEIGEMTTKETQVVTEEQKVYTELPQEIGTKSEEKDVTTGEELLYTNIPDEHVTKSEGVDHAVTQSQEMLTKAPEFSGTEFVQESSVTEADSLSQDKHGITEKEEKDTESPEIYLTTKEPELYTTLVENILTEKPYVTAPDIEKQEKDTLDYQTTPENIEKLATTVSNQITERPDMYSTEPQQQKTSTDQKLDSQEPYLSTMIEEKEQQKTTDSLNLVTEIGKISTEPTVLVEETQHDSSTKLPGEHKTTETYEEIITDKLITQSTQELSTESHHTLSQETSYTKTVTDSYQETSTKTIPEEEKESEDEQTTSRSQTTESSEKVVESSTLSIMKKPDSNIVTEKDPGTFTTKGEEELTQFGNEEEITKLDEKISDTSEESGLHESHLPEHTAMDSSTTQSSLEISTDKKWLIDEDTDNNKKQPSELSTEVPESVTVLKQSTSSMIDRVTTEPQIVFTSSDADEVFTNIFDKEVQKEQTSDNDSYLMTTLSSQPEDFNKVTESPMSLVTHVDHVLPSHTTLSTIDELAEQESKTTVLPKLDDEKLQTSSPEAHVTELQKESTESPDLHVTQQTFDTESSSKFGIQDSNIFIADKATTIMEDEYSSDVKTTVSPIQQYDFSKDVPGDEIRESTTSSDTQKATIDISQKTTTASVPVTEKESDISHEQETLITVSADENETKSPYETGTDTKDITTVSSILKDDKNIIETVGTEGMLPEQQGTEHPADVFDMHTISPEKETTGTGVVVTIETPKLSTETQSEEDTPINVPIITELTESPISVVTEIKEVDVTEKLDKPTETVLQPEEASTAYTDLETGTEKDISYSQTVPIADITEVQYPVTEQKESSTTNVPDHFTITPQSVPKLPEQEEQYGASDSLTPQGTTQIPETLLTETQTESSGIETIEAETPKPIDTEIQPILPDVQSNIGKESSTTEATTILSKETETEVINVETYTKITPTILEISQSTQPNKDYGQSEQPTQTTESVHEFSETTPFLVELKEHTHQVVDESPRTPTEEIPTTSLYEPEQTERGDQNLDVTEKYEDEHRTSSPIYQTEHDHEDKEKLSGQDQTEQELPTTNPPEKDVSESVSVTETVSKTPSTYPQIDLHDTSTIQDVVVTTSAAPQTASEKEFYTTVATDEQKLTYPAPETSSIPTEKDIHLGTEVPLKPDVPIGTTVFDDDSMQETSKSTTSKIKDITTPSPSPDKPTQPEEKPIRTTTSPSTQELTKPAFDDEINEGIPSPDFPPSGAGGYGQEPDYIEEDQAFGPGTCRYGGKVYVSAQQIPRDDPCDFCFCFRSDIICLQQSCPPPIHGCHEEPIQGFCCPRYECPVSMATTLNVTTTTTTTTTTLPPHFLPHAYKGAAQRRGCQIKGHTYKVGEVVRASSGPCLHCTCGGDGQMKCDPKACTPEPMLRQMIAAAVSAKRRR